jgi:hypothetical protein
VEGLGLADSLTVNPQKLLGITKTSSVLLLKPKSNPWRVCSQSISCTSALERKSGLALKMIKKQKTAKPKKAKPLWVMRKNP